MQSVVGRLALAVSLVLGLAVLVLTLTGVDGDRAEDCGTWWNRETSEQAAEDAEAAYAEALDGLRAGEDLGGGNTLVVRASAEFLELHRDCEAALDDRRTLVFWLMGIAVLLPPAALYVSGDLSRRRPRGGDGQRPASSS